jgi:hypothetical protein
MIHTPKQSSGYGPMVATTASVMEQANHEVTTDLGITVPYYKMDRVHFLNRSIVLYGQSETGKSTAGKHILYNIQKHIAWGMVVAPTAFNEGYDDCFHKMMIKRDVTIAQLMKIMKRQEAAVNTYNQANNIKVLASMFNMIANGRDRMAEASIINKATEIIKLIYNDAALTQSIKVDRKNKLEKKRNEHLRRLYKAKINANAHYFEGIKAKLSQEQQFAFHYRFFCPNILLIFDDFAARFAAFKKDKNFESVKEMFYNGRHYFITHIYMMQEEKELAVEIRKNIFMSIFCNAIAAYTFFSKASTGLSSQKKNIESVIRAVFQESDDGTENNNKLIYGRKINPSFQYLVPDIYEKGSIIIGGAAQWKYFDMIYDDRNKKASKSNNYFGEFNRIN